VLHNRRRRQYAAVRAHDELAQFETLCGFTHEVCDAIVDLSSAFVQSGTNPQTARALAVLPLGHHTVPAQEGSRGKTGAVGDSAKSKSSVSELCGNVVVHDPQNDPQQFNAQFEPTNAWLDRH